MDVCTQWPLIGSEALSSALSLYFTPVSPLDHVFVFVFCGGSLARHTRQEQGRALGASNGGVRANTRHARGVSHLVLV